MSGFRAILVGLGLTLGGAFIGLCAGVAIGLEVAKEHIRSAPKDVGHGPVYVAGGMCVLVSQTGLCVGAVSGLVLAVRLLRGRSTPDSGTE